MKEGNTTNQSDWTMKTFFKQHNVEDTNIMKNRQELLQHAVGCIIDALERQGFCTKNAVFDLHFEREDGVRLVGLYFRIFDPN